MSTPDNGGPAFPAPDAGEAHFSDRSAYIGMSLRDYFAAKALPIAWDAYDKGYCGTRDASESNVDLVSESAYQFADAMLKARAK